MHALLSSLRVVEVSHGNSVPLVGQWMRQAGATVIKVEDCERSSVERDTARFIAHNTGKQSLSVRLGDPMAMGLVHRLAAGADVLLTDLPPATQEEYRLTYADLRALTPALIAASITGWGLSGPNRDVPSSDLVAFHAGGVGYITPRFGDNPEQPPLRMGGEMANGIAALSALTGIALALARRRFSGHGDQVDVSLQEAVVALLGMFSAYFTYEGRSPSRETVPNLAPYHFLPALDGHVMVICPEEHHWQSLKRLMGNPPELESELFDSSAGRAEYWDAIYPVLVEWTGRRRKREIYRAAQEAHIPLGGVFRVDELFDDEQLLARGFWGRVRRPDGAGTLSMPGLPFMIDGAARDTSELMVAPRGRDTRRILRDELGLSDEEITMLAADGVVEASNLGS